MWPTAISPWGSRTVVLLIFLFQIRENAGRRGRCPEAANIHAIAAYFAGVSDTGRSIQR
jgi:hypothetical protein